MNQVILTGDRPTGALHLGHYVGSIQNRILMQNKLQENDKLFILIADTQALTDYFETPEFVRKNVFQLTEDYLACNLDPSKCCIFIQSAIRALPEITMYYMNLVSLARVTRNPTVKAELQTKSFNNDFETFKNGESQFDEFEEKQKMRESALNVPCGFVCYPISQAADITAFETNLVPVGEDQIPMIEQTNEIVRKFNNMYKTQVLKECKAVISKSPRLMGIDGIAKASKSLNNCIFLNDDSATVKQKVMNMYTDPNHIRKEDPGTIEGNMVFHYLDAFFDDQQELQALKEHYRKGGLGDVVLKQKLIQILENFLAPIRERRAKIDKKAVEEIVFDGTRKANKIADEVLIKVKDAMCLNFKI